ncbi:hypothetical protein ABL78_3868 [Leptomonas seymouri]|uniref:Uncharacterized protein n=1 Tax=Leptomonas seymouri TaxID=5684 RepID=A0A0N0P601_LEPSE|nr:hypothetical protein ABL78_3868 [Leptomonas seymouri]|eukprot:KPI87056.1 hypothetical protein ABL78_3868 [Leptomonas seymouri]
MSVKRRLAHIKLAALITEALLYGIALESTWLPSLVVRVHVGQLPYGVLPPLQHTASTSCFFSIGVHVPSSIFGRLR